jgi:hypothetical protein
MANVRMPGAYPSERPIDDLEVKPARARAD